MLSAGAVSMHASGLLHGTIDRRGKILREFLPENFHCFIVEDPSFLCPLVAREATVGRELAHRCAVSTIAVDPLRIVYIVAEEAMDEETTVHLEFLIQLDDRSEFVGGDLVEVSNHDRHAY